MSLILGTFDSSQMEGAHIILREIPSISVSTSTANPAGRQGELYQGTSVKSSRWTFNVEVMGDSVEQVLQRADSIVYNLNPLAGKLLPFTPNPFKEWFWMGVLTDGVAWRRDKELWSGVEGQQGVHVLKGELSILTPDPFGYSKEQTINVNTTDPYSPVPQVNPKGNMETYPKIIVQGTIQGEQLLTIKISGEYDNSTQFTIKSALNPDQKMVLDFANMEFYIASNADVKTANIADLFTEFQKMVIPVGNWNYEVISKGLNLTNLSIQARSRRI